MALHPGVTATAPGAPAPRVLRAAALGLFCAACAACAARDGPDAGSLAHAGVAAPNATSPGAPPTEPVDRAPAPPEPAAPAPRRPGDGPEAAREAARSALLPRCGRCHDGRLPTSLPAARAVYDLSRPDWAATLTPARWRALLRRAEGLPEAARHDVEAYGRAELARLEPSGPP